ncbi:sensor histidine kinase [Streptomyces sp. LaPpAH-108]|uniref:sensor histidine kinase n=1 Tax=Streptomyces sp. LaPpAH-108 TaxID=1155714 RepID=UPI000365EB4A|nr:histidine kinase [Streptomyces sp. LaPpAH-108]
MTLVTRAARPGPGPGEASGGPEPLVARFSRAGQRLRRADRAHPWVLDTAVVLLVVGMFCLPDLLHGDGKHGRFLLASTPLPLPVTLALQAGLVLPLLWRRRRPALAFGVIAAVFVLHWSLGIALRADIALFVALYSLALHARTRQLPWACGITAGALVPAALRVSDAVSVWIALFFLLSTATAAVALGLTVRIRRSQLSGLRERAARLETERDQRSRLAAVAERARVARDMHDVVGHNLTVLIALAEAGARVDGAARHPHPEVLRLIAGTGRQALGELRRVLGVLGETSSTRGDTLEPVPRPCLADVDALCAGMRAAGLDVVHRTVGAFDALDSEVQLTAYRIVQEALANALRHAGAGARVKLVVAVTGARLTVRVQDNGPARTTPGSRGAAPGEGHGEGHGLVGMRERTALHGGRFRAGPTDRGWLVEAVLHGKG